MKLPRRSFLHLMAGAVVLPTTSRVASAQTYPTRPVRYVNPWPPGGSTDVIARLMGQWLSGRLGQPFVVENRPGAGSNIGTEAVAKAPPDGYTILQISLSNAINATLYDKLNFDFLRDIVPVASATRGIGVLAVHPSFPAKTVPEFIAYVKTSPGKINMASGGVGSAQHLYGELFKAMAGVDMLHVPYRGGPPALSDLLAGQVPVMFDNLSTSLPHIRAGKLRALAVTSATRSPFLPDVPSIGEFVPGYDAYAWQGVGVPKNTPAAIVETLNREINAGLADPKIKARIADLGTIVFESSVANFGKFIATETEKWAKVIRTANIKVE